MPTPTSCRKTKAVDLDLSPEALYTWAKVLVLSDSLLVVSANKRPANVSWEIKTIVNRDGFKKSNQGNEIE